MTARCDWPRTIAKPAALAAALLGSLLLASLEWRAAAAEIRSAEPTPLEARLAGWVDEGADVVKPNRPGPGQPLPGFELMLPGEEPPAAEDLAEVPEDAPAIGSYFYFTHRAGQQAGQPIPYSVVGTFQPLNLDDDGVLFVNAQAIVDNDGNPGGGLTLGRRWYFPGADRMVGVAGSYDGQQCFSHAFQQCALSLESRGDLWDLFANGYLPLGGESGEAGLSQPGNLRFAGNNLVFDLLDVRRTSLSGCDVTLARRLGEANLWAFGGWYHLSGGGESVDGATAGLRGYLADRVAMDVGATDDSLFGTNVGFSITCFFGGSSGGLVSPPDVRQRMAEPLVRRSAPLVRDALTVDSTQPLTQGGIPITFTHVNGAGPGTGTGTFENPFGTLNEATGSTSRIVLLHADSVFTNEFYLLAPGQRLLGQGTGLDHVVVTDQLGPVTIPSANGGTAIPQIVNAPGPAIIADSNTEISGLNIQNPAGAGVLVPNGVNGAIDVNRVVVTGSFVESLNNAADLSLTDVQVIGSPVMGMAFNNLSGSVSVRQSVVQGAATIGIGATNVDVLLLDGVQVINSGASSLLVEVGGISTTDATIRNSTFAGGGGPSMFTFAANAGAVINLNLFNNDDDVGFQLTRDANGFTRLGGTIGQGGFFNDDNGNVANNGNTTSGGAPNVPILGAGNQIEIINPASVILPP